MARARLSPAVRTFDDILKRLQLPTQFVNVVEPRDLDEPANIVGVELVVDDPAREFVPLVWRASIYTDAPFAVLCAAV